MDETLTAPTDGVNTPVATKVCETDTIGGGCVCLTKETAWPPDLAFFQGRPIPVDQIPDTGKIPWIWEGYLAKGQLTLLCGYPKCGKTTLLSHVLVHMTFGGTLIGPIHPTKVLILTEEHGIHWRNRYQQLKFQADIWSRPILICPTTDEWYKGMAHIASMVKLGMYDLVIFDTWSDVNPVIDENDATQVKNAVKGLRQVTDAGAAVLLIHHTRKALASHGMAGRGSNALQGAVDVSLELQVPSGQTDERTPRRQLSAYSRFPETPLDIILELTEGQYLVVGTKAEEDMTDRLSMIEGILLSYPEGLSVSKLHELWPQGIIARPCQKTITRTCQWAVSQNRLTATPGAGRKAVVYRLPTGGVS